MELQINYGFIVVHPDEPYEILHFCGYQDKPTERDIKSLREELRDDPEFGLQEIWDKVEIQEASEGIVEEYKRIFGEN